MNRTTSLNKGTSLLISVISTIVLIVLDQWTKVLAVDALSKKNPIPLIHGVLEFAYVENRGAAFGIFQNGTVFFTVVGFVALTGILYLLLKMPFITHYLPMRVTLVMIAAGAIGNMIDRIQLTYVRDFIYFSLINFPVFNVADIYVTTAVCILIVLILFYYKDEDFVFFHRG